MSTLITAISPQEVLDNRPFVIHPDIFKVINELLSKRFYDNSVTVTIKTEEIVEEFLQLNPEFPRKKIFDEHHLDFEPIYRKAGWEVEFKKPDYTEDFPAYFLFSMRKVSVRQK